MKEVGHYQIQNLITKSSYREEYCNQKRKQEAFGTPYGDIAWQTCNLLFINLT